MEDEEVAESWEEAADSGVRTNNLVLMCRCEPCLTAFAASRSLRMEMTHTVVGGGWTTSTLKIFWLLSNQAWNEPFRREESGLKPDLYGLISGGIGCFPLIIAGALRPAHCGNNATAKCSVTLPHDYVLF